MNQLIPLALSANTIALMWLVGNKRILGWVLGLFGQIGWFAFIVVFEAYGLLPLATVLTFVYGRNLLRWRREQADTGTDTPPPGEIPGWAHEQDVTYDGDTHWLECAWCNGIVTAIEAGDSLEGVLTAARDHHRRCAHRLAAHVTPPEET